MYESRFGITSPPFQLGPDPKFYFESGAHRRALEQLRTGLLADSGFVVLSGEIGAGKTSLMRRLVADLGPSIRVAQIASTQLDAQELLTAVALALGDTAPPEGEGIDARLNGLHRHLRRLDRSNIRALLVIDEAQHLGVEALQCLLRVVVPGGVRPMPLQVCLVGQPELANRLEVASLHELRSWTLASAYLEGLAPDETGQYIEHRLRLAGWTGVPHFEPGAHAEIHRASRGIPRLINRLCNRLLLSRLLGGEPLIDAAFVREVAQAIHEEMGGLPAAVPEAARPRQEPRTARDGWPELSAGALWCVAGGRGDHVKALALMRALQGLPGLPPALLMRTRDNDALALCRDLYGESAPAHGRLAVDAGGEPAALAEAMGRLRPRAVIAFGGSASSRACIAAARGLGIAAFHVDAAPPDQAPDGGLDAMADIHFCSDALAREELQALGLPADRILQPGSLLADGLRAVLAGGTPAWPAGIPRPEGQYALAAWGHPDNTAERQVLADMLAIVRDISRDVPVLWLLDPPLASQLARCRLNESLAGERVTIAPAQSYAAYVVMLANATCVLTDSWSIQDEAMALGVPCLTFGRVLERPITSELGANTPIGLNRPLATRWLWDCLFNGGRRVELPEGWDGRAAERIAAGIAARLAG
jgi:general secretion pathway protein A